MQPDSPKKTGAANRSCVLDLIEREAITIVFQPIVDLRDARIIGFEALTRPGPDTGFAHAGELFETAEQEALLPELESLLRRHTFQAASDWSHADRLFLNNSPPVFAAHDYIETVMREVDEASGLCPQQIVLELTERSDFEMDTDFGMRALAFREHGFQVAIDDVGAGTSGLNRLMELRPNWIKLDLELISGIDMDPLKQNLIRFFVRFARLSNMQLIAEGIERREELVVLIELGVTHGQGYYLARPGSATQELTDEVKQDIRSIYEQTTARIFRNPTTIRISALASPVLTCDRMETVGELHERLSCHVSSEGAVVQDGRRYLGWVSADRLQKLIDKGDFDQPIGVTALHENGLIGADVTLTEAMEILAGRSEKELACPLIVGGKEGRISGIVSLRRILLAAAEGFDAAPSRVEPLTGLPNRVQADRWLASHIASNDSCNIAFIDLRNFDAYNLAYGFDMGDLMLRELVGLIQGELVDGPGKAKFFAHLGHDWFMLGFDADVDDILQQFLDRFEAIHKEFFSTIDMAAEAFSYEDPLGCKQTFPLTTVRVVYLPQALCGVAEPRDLYSLIRELRIPREAGPFRANAVITERRRKTKQYRQIA